MILDRVCISCAATFRGGPRAYYCPSCRYKRDKEATDRQRKHGPNRKLGSFDNCVRCGQQYIVNGGQQRFCETCSPIHAREYDRVTSLQHYRLNRNQINSVRMIRRRIGLITCVVCGTLFDSHHTCRNSCSEACRRILMRRYFRRADEKRRQQSAI